MRAVYGGRWRAEPRGAAPFSEPPAQRHIIEIRTHSRRLHRTSLHVILEYDQNKCVITHSMCAKWKLFRFRDYRHYFDMCTGLYYVFLNLHLISWAAKVYSLNKIFSYFYIILLAFIYLFQLIVYYLQMQVVIIYF